MGRRPGIVVMAVDSSPRSHEFVPHAPDARWIICMFGNCIDASKVQMTRGQGWPIT